MNAIFLSGTELTFWRDIESLVAGMPPGDPSAAEQAVERQTVVEQVIVAQVGITLDSGRRLRVDLQASAGYSCFRTFNVFAAWPTLVMGKVSS